LAALLVIGWLAAAPSRHQAREGESPGDHLPPYITRLTWFGERADWSLDGWKILFLEKTFGDIYEIDVATHLPGRWSDISRLLPMAGAPEVKKGKGLSPLPLSNTKTPEGQNVNFKLNLKTLVSWEMLSVLP
jgi:hypothetical protein